MTPESRAAAEGETRGVPPDVLPRSELIAVFAAAFALRLAWIFSSASSVFLQAPHLDHEAYYSWAYAIARGIEAPPLITAQQPAYAGLLSLAVRLLPDPLAGVRMLHAVLGATTLALVFAMLRERFGRWPAVAATALCGASFTSVFTDTTWSKESIALALIVFGAYGVCFGSGRNRIVGFCLLLAAPFFRNLYALPIAAGCLVGWTRQRRILLGAAAAAAILLTLPIDRAWHTWLRHGDPPPQGSGISFYLGFYPEASLAHTSSDFVRPSRLYVFADMDRESIRRFGKPAARADAEWRAAAIEEIRKTPVRAARLASLRIAAVLWAGPFDDNYPSQVYRERIGLARALPPDWLLFALGLGGAWIWFRAGIARDAWSILVAAFIAVVASMVPFFVLDRLRLPLWPILAAFAAGGFACAPLVPRTHLAAYAFAALVALNPTIAAIQAPLYREATAMGWKDLAVEDFQFGNVESAEDGFRHAWCAGYRDFPPEMMERFRPSPGTG